MQWADLLLQAKLNNKDWHVRKAAVEVYGKLPTNPNPKYTGALVHLKSTNPSPLEHSQLTNRPYSDCCSVSEGKTSSFEAIRRRRMACEKGSD